MLRRLLVSEERWIRSLLILSTITVGLVLAWISAYYISYFSDVLLMLVIAWLFAFILSPVVALIQRLVPYLPRAGAVVIVYGLLFFGLSAIVLAVAISLANSINGVINDRELQQRANALLNQWTATLAANGFDVDLASLRDQALGALQKPITDLVATSVGIIGNMLLVVFLSLFIVIDKDTILAFINRVAPPRYADEVRLFETSVASSFGGFLRGQALQGVVYAAFAAAASLIFGLDYAVATTALVAILQMIPFFGPFFSWAPPVVVAILTPNAPQSLVLGVFAIMAVGWFITMNIVQPRVMAHTVRIHPVMVLVSVLIGLKLQGPIGAIFAIPVAAVISTFFFYYLNRSAGGPRDVTSRAARLVEEREGRPVRVPTAPLAAPELAEDSGSRMRRRGRPVAGQVTPPADEQPA